LYVWCVSLFATVSRGTPSPWDPPRNLVSEGSYRWVRNPIYISALLVVLGQAWLFLSIPLLVYLAGLWIGFHLFVIGYEEPTLHRSFGETYDGFLRTVPRWFPRYPRFSRICLVLV
jgi:protein-S-isoprenylcysteine O-methyltransferase Ste14